jgi:hypothetical protein
MHSFWNCFLFIKGKSSLFLFAKNLSVLCGLFSFRM